MSLFFDDLISFVGTKNMLYRGKLLDFQQAFLFADTSGHTVSGRLGKYIASFQNMLEYPILGSMLFGVYGGGGHSELFDKLSNYGIVTSIVYFILLWQYPYRIYCAKGKKQSIDLVLIPFLIFSVTDPYTQTLGIPFFIFLPFIKRMCDNDHDNQTTDKAVLLK